MSFLITQLIGETLYHILYIRFYIRATNRAAFCEIHLSNPPILLGNAKLSHFLIQRVLVSADHDKGEGL